MAEITKAIPDADEDNDLQNLEDIPSGADTSPPDPQAGEELDKLLKASEGPSAEEIEAKKTADEEAAKVEAARVAALPVEDEAAKAKLAEEQKVAAENAAKDFERIELPPHAKPATAASFTQVKLLAKQQIDTYKADLQKTKADLAEAQTKLSTVKPLAPEIETELAELRAFRQKMDVEADPAFKSFDEQIKSNEEAIYSRLKASGLDDAALARIKELGGPAEVDWTSLADKLPQQVKRYLEGKLFENEDLVEKKKQAIEKAKSNAAEYLKTREAQVGKTTEASKAAIQGEVAKLVPQMGWLKPKEVAADAKPEDKAAVEAHNKFVTEIQADIQELSTNDSPEMRAILVVGFAQLKRARIDLAAEKAAAKATEERLTKELATANDLLTRIKKSSTTRLRESGAPNPGDVTKKPTVNIAEDSGSALDRLRAEVEAKQE